MTVNASKTLEKLKIKFLPTAAQEIKEILREVQRRYGTERAQKARHDLITKMQELLPIILILADHCMSTPNMKKKVFAALYLTRTIPYYT